MNIQRIRTACWSATVALSVASGCLLVWPTAIPPSSTGILRPIAQPPHSSSPSQSVVVATDFQPIYSLQLQRALYDAIVVPKPPAPPPPATVETPLAITLTGTALEPHDPGQSRAILQTADGKILLKKVGEKAGEALVLEIDKGSVVVSYHGSSVTLKVPKHGG